GSCQTLMDNTSSGPMMKALTGGMELELGELLVVGASFARTFDVRVVGWSCDKACVQPQPSVSSAIRNRFITKPQSIAHASCAQLLGPSRAYHNVPPSKTIRISFVDSAYSIRGCEPAHFASVSDGRGLLKMLIVYTGDGVSCNWYG